MAPGEMELPTELLESMEWLDNSVSSCDKILRSLTEVPLLDTKNELEPIEKARLDLTVAYSINSLFWTYLVTQGVDATDHPIKRELDRIKTYMSKLKGAEEKVKGATLKVDKEAAKRFIKSALWTDEGQSNPNDGQQKIMEFEKTTNADSSKENVQDLKRKTTDQTRSKKKKKKKKVKQE